MSLDHIYSGLIFRRNGTTVAFDITEYKFIKAICHTVEHHGVTGDGGFYGGNGSSCGAGAAIGNNAHCRDEVGLWIDAIQLGTGVNSNPKTLQIYDYQLLDIDGIIPVERLPNNIGNIYNNRGVEIVSAVATVVKGDYHTYIVKPVNNNVSLILPDVYTVDGLAFTFKLINSESGFAMTIERSGTAIINVNGEEWLGVTADTLGFWFTIVAKDGDYYLTQSSDITVDNNIH